MMGKGIGALWNNLKGVGLTKLNPGALVPVGETLGSIGAKVTGGAGLQAGLAGLGAIAPQLAAITAAAGAAYIAIKKLYDWSPAGQVKNAEKFAKALGEVSDNAKESLSNLKDINTKYTDYTDKIKDASNLQDYENAIQDRNEYITSLLEEDASYAQYIESVVSEGGQFVLTFKEGALEDAIKNAEEATRRAAAGSSLANAVLNSKQAEKYRIEAGELRGQAINSDNDGCSYA